MNRKILLFVFALFLLLAGCAQAQEKPLDKIGVLLPHPVDDRGWNSKGYQGILKVQSAMDLEISLKEDIRSSEAVKEAIREFAEEEAGLIIGHSHIYADIFMEVKDDFPSIHFVSFNGEVEGDNITSLHFDGYAMGYFAGMLASEMSEEGTIGTIAAFPFQPEVQGYEDGANYHSPSVNVLVEYVESWADEEKAVEVFHEMKNKGADIFYPAGDGYHVRVVEEVKKEGLYAIGYVGDQIDLGESTILTSTVQEVEKLYEYVATQFKNGELETGNKYYDFQEEVISLGSFGQEVPEDIKKWLEEQVDTYIQTGKLPHETN
ncbi:BMP family ABC transporter substrate-binding protein [Salipaludibacillus aurantiacus]|uniref:Transcriptional activator of comK protein n=1 Tax=Salipaludibacillus aurantiacus TaxID=1601833 RepID=A0A1H9TD99_9BACI|nr:BMP family ABC transporter substrate-binding protein [Salipaludibacillus aurantiacus]SER94593.1 transcriptional activator of comK gene [Salipaludibacillus aurantiacus]